MPDFCFSDTSQISKKIKVTVHKYPTYGESRTDPSYYEPTANRIANMRKSASSGVILYDYDGSDFADIANDPKLTNEQKLAEYAKRLEVSTKKHQLEPARELGITREELSQIQNETATKIDDKISKAKDEKQSKDSAKAESLQLAKEMASVVSGSEE